tara:strand:- start:4588 stop:4827 length:240 start_codon:yes stop_codon:yes gene_type:complete
VKKKKIERSFDFRIKCQYPDDISTFYHYYNCFTPEEALAFQLESIKAKNSDLKLLSVEKKNPYSNEWEDESQVLDSETS